MVAAPLGLFDCCGVSDGAAAAIVTTPEIAKSMGKHDLVSVKALQLAVSNGQDPATTRGMEAILSQPAKQPSVPTRKPASRNRGKKSPCSSATTASPFTELVTMEDLTSPRKARPGKMCSTGFITPTARYPVRLTAASNASVTRLALPAFACFTKCTIRSSAVPMIVNSTIRRSA
ncbi:MAG: hypothetical protein CM15mP75_0180 [Flammeovirgaceae bacterium]|nr:MAG: hypothetical protein CM15mP75_0180 [Flammeovirgaceae bacterium]